MDNIKGIIALTSWKARIKGVGLTIFSILKHCKGFKVVLTLSDEEFPQKEAELPADLQALTKSGVVQILWVHKNYKPYKKIIFAMKAYPDLPIISADDDCLYKYDYAGELYNKWKQNPGCIIAQTVGDGIPWGYATLHPPGAYNPYVFAAIADYCLSRTTACRGSHTTTTCSTTCMRSGRASGFSRCSMKSRTSSSSTTAHAVSSTNG